MSRWNSGYIWVLGLLEKAGRGMRKDKVTWLSEIHVSLFILWHMFGLVQKLVLRWDHVYVWAVCVPAGACGVVCEKLPKGAYWLFWVGDRLRITWDAVSLVGIRNAWPLLMALRESLWICGGVRGVNTCKHTDPCWYLYPSLICRCLGSQTKAHYVSHALIKRNATYVLCCSWPALVCFPSCLMD